MGLINTGNFRTFGNDSHTEFLLTSINPNSAGVGGAVPIERNVDNSKNNYRIIFWEEGQYTNNPHGVWSNSYCILTSGTTDKVITNYTDEFFSLDYENFSFDCWFARERYDTPSPNQAFFYFAGFIEGTVGGTFTGVTLGIYHYSSTSFRLSFHVVFPNAGGDYDLTYDLGEWNKFDNLFHYISGVRYRTKLMLNYDGKIVAITDVSSGKAFKFDKKRLDFLTQSSLSQWYYVDELRFSKNISRFWGSVSGKTWAIPNHGYTSNYRIFDDTIRAAYGYNITLDKNGNIWMWGDNTAGQLGVGDKDKRATPTMIPNFNSILQIDVGGGYQGSSFCIDSNGKVWGWGYNMHGCVGDNTTNPRCIPVSILGTNKTFCNIVAGYWHTLAIQHTGRGWCWGDNQSGQLGDNTVISKRTPISILGGNKTFCEISAGVFFCNGITQAGRVWSWGKNNYGQLGDNSVTDRCTPVSIYKLVSRTFCKIDGGEWHSMAIDKNGRVWGWGYAGYGQLGDNSIISKRTPVSILGGNKTFCEISAGQRHTTGLDNHGQAWCWGDNSYGQLGDNAIVNKCTPVSVLGRKKTFCYISAGQHHTIAVDNHGYVWAWGRNDDYSELGMPDVTTSTRTPKMIIY